MEANERPLTASGDSRDELRPRSRRDRRDSPDQPYLEGVQRCLVPRSYVRFQATAINGKPAPNAFILDISPLGTKMESPPLAIPAMSLELKFLVPGESLETRAIGEVVWLVGSGLFGLNLMGISFLKPYWEFFRFIPH